MNHNEITELSKAIGVVLSMGDKYNQNFLHNYKWREIIQSGPASNNFPGFELTPGIYGADFSSTDVTQGELKSCKGDKLKNGFWRTHKVKFEFDKQNDNTRRQQTLEYTGLMFSMFNREQIVFNFVIRTPAAIAQFKNIVKKKQREFISHMNECSARGKKIPRDTIAFRYDDLLSLTHGEYYIKGKKSTVAEFKQLFGG